MRISNTKAGEAAEQIKLFRWAAMNEEFIPELRLLYHIPNEGKRSAATGARMKAEGLRAGVPDICLPVSRRGYGALYIELKYGKNRPTKAQKEMISALTAAGNKVSVAYGAEQAREIIRHYLARAEGFDLENCEQAPKIFGSCEGFPDYPAAPCRNCEYYQRKAEEQRKGVKQCWC